MKSDEYINEALKTESIQCVDIVPPESRLLHGAMGLCTEAGELLDALKKEIFYGKILDNTNIIEELGDLFWYAAVICDVIGTNFEYVMVRNIAKLRKRYPEGFTKDAAVNRDLDAEREALEGK